jgi:hypothetical protein
MMTGVDADDARRLQQQFAVTVHVRRAQMAEAGCDAYLLYGRRTYSHNIKFLVNGEDAVQKCEQCPAPYFATESH